MSLRFRNQNGEEQVVAGLGISGELIPSASYVQRGTINVTDMGTSNDKTYKDYNVTFQTPMPDADYEVTLTSNNLFSADVLPSLTKNGFSVRVKNYALTNGTSYGDINWTAFKLITNEDRALDEQAIADLQAVVNNSGATVHGNNEPFLNNQSIQDYLIGLDTSYKYATFTVDPSSSAVTDKVNTTEWYSYNCYRQNTSWRIQATKSDGSKMYISDVAPSSAIVWKKVILDSDLTSTVTSGSTAPIQASAVWDYAPNKLKISGTNTASIPFGSWGSALVMGNCDNGGNFIFYLIRSSSTFSVINVLTTTQHIEPTASGGTVTVGTSYGFTITISGSTLVFTGVGVGNKYITVVSGDSAD